MELTYIGGHDAVDVPLPDGRIPIVANGGSYDFPDELAERMLEQPSNWTITDARPLEERIAAVKTHADANVIGRELGLVFEEKKPSVQDKVEALRAAAAIAGGDAGQED